MIASLYHWAKTELAIKIVYWRGMREIRAALGGW